ncbi:long-chain-fatty-acid--CoA ligase [Burkholderia vietnamiensis]|uniref:Long-chain-fatty-acid--CoA ligase n=1 Tax=Burkholderia vietnamiensis TaxID=60552 RepID=A0AAW7SYC1_BURVI|nr:long-chain-fatty-acid--CoA ligase [Burkholderia vietnamiensis]MBH9645850.1 long-chain-fatty-acid--CoA ligase [Burkholderia vietnamiensis]MBR8008841.1 long-chain-fatty-acid--CoA ligase [Burkholderia vietnamiensis]MDN7551301.1 long-chain-fatty-acid--CoA ligase [Burkholderia vietnamiensis]MDN7795115.1 long-chain-fatty-acid--CoA ligase [Burkholderia vietnamiensis]MDN8043627.1 long-chain-fatty-acid--CoA ligase [Burkholderia vietnamiensis]
MPGLMQDRPLLISSIIEHAATFHPNTEIVSRLPGGDFERTNWLSIRNGALRVAGALSELGIQQGARVGTLAWNTRRHLELYYGISSSGAVMHTINPRLFAEQIEYIVNHAEDEVLFFDVSFAPLIEKLAPRLKSVRAYVAMCELEHMPQIDVPNLLCYDALLAHQSGHYQWPILDERSASALCYTSGTTGNPKGVLYSHRSTVLHALMAMSPDAIAYSASDKLLLVVPMFHANAWGAPYAAAMVGSSLVLPGHALDGKSVYETIRNEKVTFSAGVPTVWMMLFQYLDANPHLNPRELGLKRVGIAGAAVSRSVLDRFENDFGAQVVQGWGMTETSPIGVVSTLLPKHGSLERDTLTAVKLKQGRGVWGVELKLAGDDGETVPWDGVSRGHLSVRGPWVASGYFKGEGGNVLDDEGFFPTGDIATIDQDGYLQLVDRAKDVIKSGGEWISSVDVENAVMSHPDVAEAAVIGVPHPKWQERPLLLVVTRVGREVTKDALLAFLSTRIAKWWLPDDVVFVTELPHTATGKVLKLKLREQYADHKLA